MARAPRWAERHHIKRTHVRIRTDGENKDEPPADTSGGRHAGGNKSELQPGR